MASYTLNEEAVRHAEALIKARRYVLTATGVMSSRMQRPRTPTSTSARGMSMARGI